LTVSKNASISGSLLVRSNIAAKGTVSGATINGFGLGSCNGSTQKVVYNNTSNAFECATDQTAGSGLSFTATEASTSIRRRHHDRCPDHQSDFGLFGPELLTHVRNIIHAERI